MIEIPDDEIERPDNSESDSDSNDHKMEDISDFPDASNNHAPSDISQRDDAVYSFYGHEMDKTSNSNGVYQVAVNNSNTLAISGGADETLRLWTVDHETKEIFVENFKDSVTLVGWNKKFTSVFYGIDLAGNVGVFNVVYGNSVDGESRDNQENIENTASSSLNRTLNTSILEIQKIFETELCIDVEWATWHPTASFLLIGLSDSGLIYMYNISTKSDKNYVMPPRIFTSEGFRTTCFHWYDEKNIIVGYENGSITNFSLKSTCSSNSVKKLENLKYDIEPVSMSLSNDKSLLAVGRSDGKVTIILIIEQKMSVLSQLTIDDPNNTTKNEDNTPQSVESVKFQPNTKKIILACGCINGNITIYEYSKVRNWFIRVKLNRNSINGITCLNWLDVGDETGFNYGGPRLLVSGDVAGSIRIWDFLGTNSEKNIKKICSTSSNTNIQDTNTDMITNIDIPTSTSNTNSMEINNLPENCVDELYGHDSSILCLCINRKYILTSSEDGSCKVFDVAV